MKYSREYQYGKSPVMRGSGRERTIAPRINTNPDRDGKSSSRESGVSDQSSTGFLYTGPGSSVRRSVDGGRVSTGF